MNSDLRRGSYVDLASCLDADNEDNHANYELEEDHDNPGETGSSDMKKRPVPAAY